MRPTSGVPSVGHTMVRSTPPAILWPPSAFKCRGPTGAQLPVRSTQQLWSRGHSARGVGPERFEAKRNHADYDVHLPHPTGDESNAVAAAEFILQTLDALTSAERTQITDAIKLYEQAIRDVTWTP